MVKRNKINWKSILAFFFVGIFLIGTASGGIIYSIKYTAASKYPIIPRPSLLEPQPGNLVVTRDFSIYADNSSQKVTEIAEYFGEKLGLSSGVISKYRIIQNPHTCESDFNFIAKRKFLGEEGYYLQLMKQTSKY